MWPFLCQMYLSCQVQQMVEEVLQKKIPISYNIIFCGTFSTSVAEEEAPATEEDTLAQHGQGAVHQ